MQADRPASEVVANLGLQRLQVFVAVVDSGGFSAAAAHLDLGQPTVSFHVRALERLLGTPLLASRGRRIQLTPEGEEVYRAARGMLREAERLVATLRQAGEGQVGQVHLGASIAFELAAFFTRVLGPFQRAHPRLQLSVRFGHSVALAEAVLRQEIDAAYVQRWRLPAGVHYQPLHQADFVLMVAAHHPLARKQQVSAAEVAEAGLITAPLFSAEWPHYERLLHAAGIDRPRIGLEVDGVQARLLATQAGLGVMGVFVPPYAEAPIAPNLQPLSLDNPPPRAEFGLVTAPREQWSPALRAFVTWLRQATGDDATTSAATENEIET